MSFFPDPKDLSVTSLIFMIIVYGYILMVGADLVGHGSEMLLLLSGPGLIGGLLIPVVCTIPDCIIILISGMGEGSKKEIEHELTIGVGSLIGSTITVLTIRWALAVFLARRDIDPLTDKIVKHGHMGKKVSRFSLKYNGVKTLKVVIETAKIMMYSTLAYFVVQIPAFFLKKNDEEDIQKQRPWALADLIICCAIFLVYCYIQYQSGQRGVLIKLKQEDLRREQWKMNLDSRLLSEDYQEFIFKKHDRDNSNSIDPHELKTVLADLGLSASRATIQNIMERFDVGCEEDGNAGEKDGKISLNEFKNAIRVWFKEGNSFKNQESSPNSEETQSQNNKKVATAPESSSNNNNIQNVYRKKLTKICDSQDDVNNLHLTLKNIDLQEDLHEHYEHEDEEAEEDHHLNLTDKQLVLKAIRLIFFGTVLCGVFSEPLVGVIGEISNKLSISPFYVSFVVSPIALNSREVISSFSYAKKKTTNSISLLLASFNGSATMNNTLALAIFLGIIYFRELPWSFTAEVIAVVLVIIIVGVNSLSKRIRLWQAILVGLLYPLSVLFVYIMKTFLGFD